MIDIETRLNQASSELRRSVGAMDVAAARSVTSRHIRQRLFASLGLVVVLLGAVGLTSLLVMEDVATDAVAESPQASTATTAPKESTPTPAVNPAPMPVDVTHLIESVEASSELSDRFGADRLIDGDLGTSWQDAGAGGQGAEIIFRFSEPVAITEIALNPIQDREGFLRNYWIQGYTITTNDLSVPITGRLANVAEPQTITLDTDETVALKLSVTTTYPAETVADKPPFEELAVAEIQVIGIPSAQAPAANAEGSADTTTTVTRPVLAEPTDGIVSYDTDQATYESLTRGDAFLGGGSSQGAPWAIIGRVLDDGDKPRLFCSGVRPLLNEDVCATQQETIWPVVYPVGDAGIVVFRPTQDAVTIVVTFDDGDAIEIPVVGVAEGFPAIAVISVDSVGQAGSATSLNSERVMIDTVRWEVTGFFEPQG